ncbi:MAG: 4-hydroxy-3-methylbut-2-enyl diphosphate reductase [Nitrospirae bacterium]|nr:4-hydroxy-3-methylbut-2-enyl diphosphate reductase [Nitrospirota bacterium]MCL5421728.1 4-hydroxy-3-methylbut-2-enyl diphosphate reductase [Nitrospirota bacterium]
MEILIAKGAGFCFGVKRAIDIAFAMADKKQEGIYTFGPVIHNPQVVEKLREKGIAPTDDICKDDIKVLIIRTHGIPLDLMEGASKSGYEIVDATCPFVTKAQHYAKLLNDDGYQVIILGDRDHPEVRGLMSYAGDDALVIDGKEELPELKSRVGIVVQTTQPVDGLKRLMGKVIERSREIKVYNTICNSTALRLKETEEMAGEVDVMVVVGGKNSANTTQLANLCAARPVRTHHIETAEELRPEWFDGAGKVGITAGASTPDWIIDEVKERIKDIGGEQGDGT